MSQSNGSPACTIITGGSRGIGLACAKLLSAQGPVFLVGTKEANLVAACDGIRSLGRQAEYLAGDVADRQTALSAVARVKELGWSVRNLVCSAGVGGGGSIATISPQKWERVFAVNVHGSFHFIQACVSSMIEQKGGSISLISSTLGVRGWKYDSCYSATKHAQVGMGRSLGQELAKHGISVVPICPAFVDTDMVSQMVSGLMKHRGITDEAARQVLEEKSPRKRIIPVEEVAEAVALVVSGKLRCLNGEPLILDDGAE